METKNRVELVGHVGRDPELLQLESGTKLAKFSLATNELFKNTRDEWVDHTTWHRIVAWGKMADWVMATVSKGIKLEVVGTIKTNTFTTAEGVKKYFTDIRCDEFKIVEQSEAVTEDENKDPKESKAS